MYACIFSTCLFYCVCICVCLCVCVVMFYVLFIVGQKPWCLCFLLMYIRLKIKVILSYLSYLILFDLPGDRLLAEWDIYVFIYLL